MRSLCNIDSNNVGIDVKSLRLYKEGYSNRTIPRTICSNTDNQQNFAIYSTHDNFWISTFIRTIVDINTSQRMDD